MEACQNSGSNHPICPTHQRLAKLRVVKDKLKDNYGRPFFTCSDRHDPCNFWQWGDIYESSRPRCKHGMTAVDFSNGKRSNLVWPRLASSYSVPPLEYRYKNEDTGETFTSTNINAKEAYEEFLKKYE
ncbi:endonuclease 8-like 3 [Paramuricea clavata]|uniref:Endonuclease 8-like 3 n=1 Tax=Paramuricea clavata TaxID=317549 RepID=A0A7D9ILM5_PARCT|nr:endonuclease 8-like 3 [Paramuricea clavata]